MHESEAVMTISHRVAAGPKITGILPIPPPRPHLTEEQTEPREEPRIQTACTVLFYQSPPNGACGVVPVEIIIKQTWLGLPMPIRPGFSRVAGEK